jgi:hypothetical protein
MKIIFISLIRDYTKGNDFVSYHKRQVPHSRLIWRKFVTKYGTDHHKVDRNKVIIMTPKEQNTVNMINTITAI